MWLRCSFSLRVSASARSSSATAAGVTAGSRSSSCFQRTVFGILVPISAATWVVSGELSFHNVSSALQVTGCTMQQRVIPAHDSTAAGMRTWLLHAKIDTLLCGT